MQCFIRMESHQLPLRKDELRKDILSANIKHMSESIALHAFQLLQILRMTARRIIMSLL